MKHWLVLGLSTLALSFIFGIWWGAGYFQKNQHPRPVKHRLTAVVPQNFLSDSVLSVFRDRHQTELTLLPYADLKDLEQILQTQPHDIVIFSSTWFENLKLREIFLPLDSTRFSNLGSVSHDLRFSQWDAQENFALPLAWQTFVFVKNPKRKDFNLPPSTSLPELEKKYKLGIVSTPETLRWAAEEFDPVRVEKLLWFNRGEELEFLEKSDLLLIEWSRFQHLKESLGADEPWYPEQKLPFMIYFAGLSKTTRAAIESEELLNLFFDPQIYAQLWAPGRAGMVMNFSGSNAPYSAAQFRKLPLSKLKPFHSRDLIETTVQDAE